MPMISGSKKGLPPKQGKGQDSYMRKIYEKGSNNNKIINNYFGASSIYNISLVRWK